MRKLVCGKDFAEFMVLRNADGFDASECGVSSTAKTIFVVKENVALYEVREWLASGEAEKTDGLNAADTGRFFVARKTNLDGVIRLFPLGSEVGAYGEGGNFALRSEEGLETFVFGVPYPVAICDFKYS